MKLGIFGVAVTALIVSVMVVRLGNQGRIVWAVGRRSGLE